jgi:hypothetical protein
MDVVTLLEPKIDLHRLAEVLDGLGHEGRVHTVGTWTKKQMRAIYDAAKGFRPIDIDFLVPASGVLEPVSHDGKNSLPLFSTFQKHFMKVEGADYPAAGRNSGQYEWVVGDGYFIVTKGEGDHEGELGIDYTKVPKDKPADWPDVRENTGLGPGLTYGGMVDWLRGISTHVSIGAAFKGGKGRDQFFALVRRDPG